MLNKGGEKGVAKEIAQGSLNGNGPSLRRVFQIKKGPIQSLVCRHKAEDLGLYLTKAS